MLPAHLAEAIRRQVLYYLQSTFEFRDSEAAKAFEAFLEDPKNGLFKGPWVQLQRPFRPAPEGVEPPFDIPVPFHPFVHQWRAWQRLTSRGHDPQPTIITTGTGSGKTEGFLYPILDHCLRARRAGQRGIKAIVLYPMNALAADQERRFAANVWNTGVLKAAGIRVGTYTGRYDPSDPAASRTSGTRGMGQDHGISNHEAQQDDPPDVLLTNYKMLDFLLLRPEDQRLWRHNAPGVLRYLVLDELHTYDGAQGADVACLVRRLKERLGIARGELCVVGTSATLETRREAHGLASDAMDSGGERLARFASTLFEEAIPSDSVIGEDRLTVEEIVRPDAEEVELPPAADCRPLEGEDALMYAQRQAGVWGAPRYQAPGEPADEDQGARAVAAWALALGEWFKRLKIFRFLLEVFAVAEQEGPLEWGRLIDGLARAELGFSKIRTDEERGAIAVALFAMVAQAREERSGRAFPLVPTQVQLWVRELRRLGRAVGEKPSFVWLDEPPQGVHALPAFHCSECGDSGWIGLHDPSDDTLIQARGVRGFRIGGDPTDIYNGWFGAVGRKDQRIVVLSPWDETDALAEEQPGLAFAGTYLCPHSLVVREQDGPCPITGDARRIRVKVDRKVRTQADGAVVGQQGCPSCGSQEGVFIIGSQAATLASVALDELFGSVLNSDPKLLAFTDSVQDASHRAGFFSARTFHFTLRTAIQHVVDDAGPAGVPLQGIGRRLLEWWSQPRVGSRRGIKEAMATLLPSDLKEYTDWREYRDNDAADQPPPELLNDIAERLSWQVVSEFGVMQLHGRSLETSAASSLAWDEHILGTVVKALRDGLEGISPALVGLGDEKLRLWVLGMLYRYRLRGALGHPYLTEAARSFWGRSRYGRGDPRRELFPPKGRFTPSLMVTARDRKHEHVLAPTSGNQAPWHVRWARRALDLPGVDEGALLDLIRAYLREGARAGLLEKVHQDGQKEYYAISPNAARLTSGGQRLECARTRRAIVRPVSEAALWAGAPSLEYYAEHSTYARTPLTARQQYYCDRYRKGALRRVVAEEHTGLLTTGERERVERQFAGAAHADDPNVLACTSTLEMGIDIGDLSSTMLCSVPPTTASYLQRIGRAGRATGTALIVAVVNQRPHDLFFYARPSEMLRGRVDPPGCWLDASAVLVRQYLAFCFDSAVREGVLAKIPKSGREMADDLESEDGQLRRLMGWVAQREDELRATFLGRFSNDIQDDTRGRFLLETAAELLLQRMYQVVNEFSRALRDLENARARLREQLKELGPDEGEAKLEIERELQILRGRSTGLARVSALELLTDHGLLPNYAFPERGVRFYGAVYNRYRREDRDLPAIELMRNAAAAIKELAPANFFYTHSRCFDIQQIGIGSPQQSLVEPWAVCGACGHMRPAEELARPSASVSCPQCHHGTAQLDQGQQRRFLEFARSQALSYVEHYESQSADHSDERRRALYQVERSFDVTVDEPAGAVGEDGLPFGIEYRSAMVVRDVNVGYLGRPGVIPFGAGVQVPDQGFQVCLDCGVVVPPRGQSEDSHTLHRRSCSGRRRFEKLKQEGREGAPFRWDSVYLFRELRSEAIRLLVPLTDDEDVDTLTACLYLGLRLRLGGNPQNLKVVRQVMPDLQNLLNRYYLVLVDEVPGGTGYLKTLYQETDEQGRPGEGIMSVLRLAKAVLETCTCRQPSEADDRDGCYRCVRSFHMQYRADHISRERGIRLLERLCDAGDRRVEIERLEQIKATSLVQSVLERRFLDRLQEWVKATNGAWEKTLVKGSEGYRFRVGESERLWDLEAQPKLGPAQGVAIACQPDFLLRCDDEQVLPVAVFTDGFEFHCHPNNRLADDCSKRRAILESRGYRVWSIAWADLNGEGADVAMVCVAPVVERLAQFATAERAAGDRWPGASEAVGNGFSQLLAFLRCPDERPWRELASFVAFWPLQLLADQRVVDGAELTASLDSWREGAALSRPEPIEGGGWVYNDRASLGDDVVACIELANVLTVRRQRVRVLIRIQDADDAVRADGFVVRWRQFLAMMNLYQFCEGFRFWATSEVLSGTAPELPLQPLEALPDAWRNVVDSVVPTVRPLAELLARHRADVPVVEHVLDDVDDDVFAEMAWPEAHPSVAVLAGEQESLAEIWEQRGWRVVSASSIDSDGADVLRLLEVKGRGA